MAAFSLPSWLSRTFGARPAQAWCRTALASKTSLQASVEEIASQLRGAGPADLALVFVAASYASDLPRLLPIGLAAWAVGWWARMLVAALMSWKTRRP